jgi:hypothetical protein
MSGTVTNAIGNLRFFLVDIARKTLVSFLDRREGSDYNQAKQKSVAMRYSPALRPTPGEIVS